MGSAFQGRAPICRTGFEQHGLHLVLCRGWLSFLLNPTAFPQDLHRFNFDGFLAFDSACCRRCCLAVLRDLRRMVQTGTAGFAIEGGASLSPEFLALWIGLTFFTSSSIAEIIRAGVLAVPRGQWHAAEALGMTRLEAISYVIFRRL